MTDVQYVTPSYRAGEQIDMTVPDGRLEGTYSTSLEAVRNDTIELNVPKVNGLYVPLKENETVILKQYDEGATFEGETDVVDRYELSGNPIIEVGLPSTVKRIQRRDFVRVPCDIPADVYVLKSENDGNSLPSSFEGTLQDISAGGTQLLLSRKLSLGTEIELEFELPVVDKRLTEVFGTVLRVPDTREGPYSLGVEFDSITENKRNVIIQYVYKRQMELRD